MSRRRIIRVAAGAVISLLIVPVMVNVRTGGDAPSWLARLGDWQWLIAGACVLGWVALELSAGSAPPTGETVEFHRPADPRNVGLALTQVARYLAERRRFSFAEIARIGLDLDEVHARVSPPVHLVRRVGTGPGPSGGMTVVDFYDELDQSMLILGAPGAGKSTQLLELAQNLVDRAHTDPTEPIPVVLDLSGWALSQSRRGLQGTSFRKWVRDSVADRFGIPDQVSRQWLAEDRLVLLLDGLDEVSADFRESCLAEINAIQQAGHFPAVTRVVVCSREGEYLEIKKRLRLQGAVLIQPLERDAVREHLTSINPRLAGVLPLLDAYKDLWSLLTTPLMLAVVLLARLGPGAAALSGRADPAGWRRALFDAYVVEVLARRRSNEPYPPEEVLHGVRMLARASAVVGAGTPVPTAPVSEPRRYLPDRARAALALRFTPWAALVTATVCTASAVLRVGDWIGILPVLLGSLVMLRVGSVPVLRPAGDRRTAAMILMLVVLISAAVGSAAVALFAASPAVVTTTGVLLAAVIVLLVAVTRLGERSRSSLSQVDRLILLGFGANLGFGVLAVSLRPHLMGGWILAVLPGSLLIIVWLTHGKLVGDTLEPSGRVHRPMWVTWACAVAGCAFLPAGSSGFDVEFALGYLLGLVYALILGALLFATVIQDVMVRAAVGLAGLTAPWSEPFLRFCLDRSLLTRAGPDYRFIHLLVRDHLADCEPTTLATEVTRRRTEVP